MEQKWNTNLLFYMIRAELLAMLHALEDSHSHAASTNLTIVAGFQKLETHVLLDNISIYFEFIKLLSSWSVTLTWACGDHVAQAHILLHSFARYETPK